MRKFWLLAPLFAALPAYAGPPHGTGAGGPSYTGIGDVQAMTAWGGARAYNAAIAAAGTQTLFNALRASDSEKCDFQVATNGGVGVAVNCTGADNGVSLATFMNATTASATEIYDQTGNGHHWIQNTPANQPQIILNCINTTLPCFQTTSNVQIMPTTANITPATGVVTFVAVAERVTGTGTSPIVSENATANLNFTTTTGQWNLTSASGGVNQTASNGAFHAGIGVIDTTNSLVNIDGVDGTIGTMTGSTSSGTSRINRGTNATTINFVEGGFADNVAVNSGTRAALHSNMAAYYGTP